MFRATHQKVQKRSKDQGKVVISVCLYFPTQVDMQQVKILLPEHSGGKYFCTCKFPYIFQDVLLGCFCMSEGWVK